MEIWLVPAVVIMVISWSLSIAILAYPALASRHLLKGRRMVVNLKSGRAVDGVLVRRAGSLLFLRNAVAMEPGADAVSLDGEAVIDRADIDFIQAL